MPNNLGKLGIGTCDYDELLRWDLLGPVKNLFKSGAMYWDDDDKKIHLRVHPLVDSPWIHAKIADWQYCYLHHKVYFDYYSVVHPVCANCWKCVVRPNTLSEMVDVLDYQLENNMDAKCGIEIRPFINHKYGAYFYNNNFEQALDMLDKLQSDMKQIGNIPVILKRACTEYERRFGPSHNWRLSDGAIAFIQELDNAYSYDGIKPVTGRYPDIVNRASFIKWVEFARRFGDDTFKKFTKGADLEPSCVTYNRPEAKEWDRQ